MFNMTGWLLSLFKGIFGSSCCCLRMGDREFEDDESIMEQHHDRQAGGNDMDHYLMENTQGCQRKSLEGDHEQTASLMMDFDNGEQEE